MSNTVARCRGCGSRTTLGDGPPWNPHQLVPLTCEGCQAKSENGYVVPFGQPTASFAQAKGAREAGLQIDPSWDATYEMQEWEMRGD